jgi:Flp pilus assembly secretin CpaC
MAKQIQAERDFPMSRNSVYRLSVMIFGMAVCLILPACRTCTEKACDTNEVSAVSDPAHDTQRKLKETIIPEMTFYAPATIVDAIDFLNKASHEYAKLGTPLDQRCVNFDLRLPSVFMQVLNDDDDPFAAESPITSSPPRLAAISVRTISLYDALHLVCEVTDMKWRISERGLVVITPNKWNGLVTRSYNIPQALVDSLLSSHNGQPSDTEPNKVWKAFFEQLGVTGPERAEFNYLPTINKLRVTSTLENLAIIEQVFEVFALRMVEVEMQIQAFRTADIEHLRLSGGMSLESLIALRQKGKSKQVASATALTKSGQEAIVKAVQEVIYPAELLADVGKADSTMTARSTAKALMPGSFTMQETGMILQVVPEVIQSGSLINLVLRPQWVTLEGWESYPVDLSSSWTHHAHSFKQPIFGVTSFETQTLVKDGGTVLLGSCSTPDGEWVHVGFLAARLKNVQPLYAGNRTDKATSQATLKDTEVEKKMREIVIPEVVLRPPATIIDALQFFKDASIKYDQPGVCEMGRGINFVLKLPMNALPQTGSSTNVDPFASSSALNGVPVIPAMSARFINLYDAVKLVCDVTSMKLKFRDGIVWIVPLRCGDGELITRIYSVSSSPPCAVCERTRADAGLCSGDNHRQDWRPFFEQLGVNWPLGSSLSVKEVASVSLSRVTNTDVNLCVFENALEYLGVYPRMVEVDVQIHAFTTEDIEKLRLSSDMSLESLMALRKKGKSKQVASATALVKSGGAALVKAVREVRYPTELSNTSGQGGGVLMPSAFVFREVGMTLQVFPEITATDQPQLRLKVKPQWVTLEGWKSYPANLGAGWAHKTLAFKQPVFGMTSFETETIVQNGGTVLLGSSSTPDGKWVHVGFLTAKECR